MTETQIGYINFLLKKLDFDEIGHSNADDFTEVYFKYLQKSYLQFRNIANCKPKRILHNNIEQSIPENGLVNFKYRNNGEFFEVLSFSIFNYLQLEIKIKEKKWFQSIYSPSAFISASDISNFTYCPASYAISKSINYKILSSAKIGSELHESSIISSLIDYKYKKTINKEYDSPLLEEDNFKNLKETLKNCEILYNGHSEKGKDFFFKSKKGHFIGQPDFIIRNKDNNETFVIEEKYIHIPKEFINYGNNEFYNNLEKENEKKRSKEKFYENHLNQLLSYIYGISEYRIDYGIIIYWKYEVNEKTKTITQCYFKKVRRNEELRDKLNKIYSAIKSFKNQKHINFNITNRNPNKCANCINNYLCGHKTGKFDFLTLPYDSEFLKIQNVAFPEYLKQSDNFNNSQTYIERMIDNIEPDNSIDADA